MARNGSSKSRSHRRQSARDERGFSLIEVLAAMLILTAGLLPLAALFATAVQRMGATTPMMVAREKGARGDRERARRPRYRRSVVGDDSQRRQRRRVSCGARPIKDPGGDGLVNTADDGDDELSEELFTREIDISTLNIDGTGTVNPNLRQVTVTVRYRVGNFWQTYSLVTYISSYS